MRTHHRRYGGVRFFVISRVLVFFFLQLILGVLISQLSSPLGFNQWRYRGPGGVTGYLIYCQQNYAVIPKHRGGIGDVAGPWDSSGFFCSSFFIWTLLPVLRIGSMRHTWSVPVRVIKISEIICKKEWDGSCCLSGWLIPFHTSFSICWD